MILDVLGLILIVFGDLKMLIFNVFGLFWVWDKVILCIVSKV